MLIDPYLADIYLGACSRPVKMLHRTFLQTAHLFNRQIRDAMAAKQFAVFHNDKKIPFEAVNVLFPERPEQLRLVIRIIHKYEMINTGEDQRISCPGGFDIFQYFENPTRIGCLPLVWLELQSEQIR